MKIRCAHAVTSAAQLQAAMSLRVCWRHGLQVAIFCVCTMGVGARGAAINTGVEGLLIPAVILASPVVIVGNLIFGSDDGARKSAEKEAQRILDTQKELIPVNGLYTGSIDLKWALSGMMVESKLPRVEINTEGSIWLLKEARDPAALAEQAARFKYIHLTLGDRGGENCFPWRQDYHDWTLHLPIKPGTCLQMEFSNELQADLELNVDASRVNNRELRWNLVERATGKALLSIPFWVSQLKGQPLNVGATYRVAHETYPFVKVIQKLSPINPARIADGSPRILNRSKRPLASFENSLFRTNVTGEIRLPELSWPPTTWPKDNVSWNEGYEKALASGKPFLLNRNMLIDLQRQQVGEACASPGFASSRCDFAYNFLYDGGVISTNSDHAYKYSNLASEMSLSASVRTYDGQLLWYITISPSAVPELCRDWSRGCIFFPHSATLVDEKLIFYGRFTTTGRLTSEERGTLDQPYELVIALREIPKVVDPRKK